MSNDELNFAKEDPIINTTDRLWNILIVDDDKDIHEVTKLALANFEYENRKCHFISAYSAKEAEEVLKNTPNIALAFVDVVMEDEHSGLDLIDTIRNKLHNKLIRLVLRTGQPGQAPEEKIIYDYDINDYKAKNELTTQKLFTATLTSLRAYRDLIALQRHKNGLFKIIESTAHIEKMSSLQEFLSALLQQIVALLYLADDTVEEEIPIFIAAIEDQKCQRIVGLGQFKDYDNTDYNCKTNEVLQKKILQSVKDQKDYEDHESLIIFQKSRTHYEGFVLYINIIKDFDDISRQLIKIFLEKATIAYENAMLQTEMDETQKDVIFTLSEIAEQRSYETGKHVKRVAKYCALLAKEYGLSQEEIDTLYASSPMHDIGKIAIADNILQKPGALDEAEFEIMKTHTTIGHDMLKSSTKGVFKMSALISLQHHEKWDGSGYPNKLKGDAIHIFARITTLADVYDALGSKRIYKEAWEHEKILQFIKDEKGKHFDPDLVNIFFQNIDKFIIIKEQYKDTE